MRLFAKFILVFILLVFGANTAFSQYTKEQRRKMRKLDVGILSIKTSPLPLTVKIDGKILGKSGTKEAAEFYLKPGVRTVEIEGPNGTTFKREINVVKGVMNCICLGVVEFTKTKPCPYDFELRAAKEGRDGDLFIVEAINKVTKNPVMLDDLKFIWRVSPGSATFEQYKNNQTLRVDSTDLGGSTLKVGLQVSDRHYGKSCAQELEASISVHKLPPIEGDPFDEFVSVSNDDDKARLDGLAIELQNNPTFRAMIIIRPGKKESKNFRSPRTLSKMAREYLVQKRGVASSRLTFVEGAKRDATSYQILLLPPGVKKPSVK